MHGNGLESLLRTRACMPRAWVRPRRIMMERPTWNRSRGNCANGIFFIAASAASGHTSASGIGLHAFRHALGLKQHASQEPTAWRMLCLGKRPITTGSGAANLLHVAHRIQGLLLDWHLPLHNALSACYSADFVKVGIPISSTLASNSTNKTRLSGLCMIPKWLALLCKCFC